MDAEQIKKSYYLSSNTQCIIKLRNSLPQVEMLEMESN